MADSGVAKDWARFHTGGIAGVTVMHAHFTRHAFEKHSHETYSIGRTATGIQNFHCGGALHSCRPGDLILFNPDQAHDGQRGAPEGFGYSMLYVPAAVIDSCADRGAGLHLPRYFKRPVVLDPRLARAYLRAVDAAGQAGESMRAEELTRDLLCFTLARHGESPREAVLRPAGALRMERVRDYLCAHAAGDVTVEALARVAGLSRTHLTRAFSAHFGMPPHVFLNSERLRQARTAMLAGSPLAEVATACGFADQAHFSRRFKGATGLAPAQWLRQVRASGWSRSRLMRS